jgi:hypothetical protein
MLVAMAADTLAILVANAAEAVTRRLVVEVCALLIEVITVPIEVILADTDATASAFGIAVPAMYILVAAYRLFADTSPENSAATPDTFVVKLPVAATKLVALTEVVKLPIEAVIEEILRSGLTLRDALVEAVLTQTPASVIIRVPLASVIVSKEPAAMSFS